MVIACTSRSFQRTDHGEPESCRADTECDRNDDIADRSAALTVSRQRQRLQTEGGYSGVTAQKSRHREQPWIWRSKQRCVVARQSPENADQERSAHVDEQGAPRERLAGAPRDEARNEITRDAAQYAAQHET